jgi:superfamily II DNA/RNA helicase
MLWGPFRYGQWPSPWGDLACVPPSRIIATPGRLVHVAVEMNLKLQSVEYVVFDEADR